MHRSIALFLALAGLSAAASAQTGSKTLDIYYIDTEGGQATLFVAPGGQTVLIDTGNNGTRDPNRIIEATRAAGVKQIDYLLITHYHGDHVGSFPSNSPSRSRSCITSITERPYSPNRYSIRAPRTMRRSRPIPI